MFFDIHCWKLQLVFVGVGYENFIYVIFAMQKDDSKFIVVIHHNIWKEYYLLVSAQRKCCKWELCSCDVLYVYIFNGSFAVIEQFQRAIGITWKWIKTRKRCSCHCMISTEITSSLVALNPFVHRWIHGLLLAFLVDDFCYFVSARSC